MSPTTVRFLIADRTTWLASFVAFSLAFALRWPSCGESFWVDELHSAWAADGTWNEVALRAASGNQQSLYFRLLWIWQHLPWPQALQAWGMEPLLRLSSVMASALSAGGLVFAGRQMTGSLVAGVASGLSFALESNAIFFGTETRPYAAVMLCSVMACFFAGRVLKRDSFANSKHTTARSIALLYAVVLVAALLHLTSLIVLIPLLLAVACFDVWQTFDGKTNVDEDLKTQTHCRIRLHLVLLGILCAVVTWVVFSQASVWQSRANWQSFASANSIWQVWKLWPWTSLLLVPAVAFTIVRGWMTVAKLPTVTHGRLSLRESALIATVLLSSTFGCFLLASMGGLPLWHRRYLVAGLPQLCILFGCLVSLTSESISQLKQDDRFTKIQRWGIVLVCLVVLAFQQGNLAKLTQGNIWLARRLEGWREAVAFLNQHIQPGDTVWVDPALIEQSGLETPVTDTSQKIYLTYVIRGPYQLDIPTLEIVATGDQATRLWRDNSSVNWLLSRRQLSSSANKPPSIETHHFGRVWVKWRGAKEPTRKF